MCCNLFSTYRRSNNPLTPFSFTADLSSSLIDLCHAFIRASLDEEEIFHQLCRYSRTDLNQKIGYEKIFRWYKKEHHMQNDKIHVKDIIFAARQDLRYFDSFSGVNVRKEVEKRAPENPNNYNNVPETIVYTPHLLSNNNRENRIKNIKLLILGESGVGKTTFINGLHLYLKHKLFQEADNSELELIITSSFFCTDEEIKNKYKITIYGKQEHSAESLNLKGESSTNSITPYWLSSPSTKREIVCLDTPGINDTQGKEKDRQYSEALATHLSNYSELDAICILLKPNEPRLSPEVRYCFEHLLRIHKKAVRNIYFCFTNAPTGPGDTLTALTRFLEEINSTTGEELKITKGNCFCFDNSCVRYLCMIKKEPILRMTQMDSAFSHTWRKNYETTQDFLLSVIKNTPFSVKETRNILMLEMIQYIISEEMEQWIFSKNPETIGLVHKVTCYSAMVAVYLKRNSLFAPRDHYRIWLYEMMTLKKNQGRLIEYQQMEQQWQCYLNQIQQYSNDENINIEIIISGLQKLLQYNHDTASLKDQIVKRRLILTK